MGFAPTEVRWLSSLGVNSGCFVAVRVKHSGPFRWRVSTGICCLLAGLAALCGSPQQVTAAPPMSTELRPAVSVTTEALLLWRDGGPDRPLYFDNANPAIVPLDAGMITTGMAAGPRYRIDLSPSGEGAWEFNYFNVRSFTGSRSVDSPQGDLEQDDIFGYLFPDVTSAQAVASSGIQSFELNRREPLARFDGDFLYGFRWVEWNDRLAITDTTVTGTLTGSDRFIANTFDSLYGAQVGLDMVLLGDRDRAWIEGLGKAGIYYNNASQSSFVDSVTTTQVSRSGSKSVDRTSFFGELGFTGCVRLGEHWTARAGFTMFWLGNGTAAADQLSVNNLFSSDIETGIDTGSSVFLYGVNLGLQAAW